MPSDPAGALEAETTIESGSGSQTGTLSRWGDYSAMTVDPVDDCTFWYTQEYLKTNGSFNWNTRIANFKFPGCTTGTYIGFYPDTLDFGVQPVGTTSAAPQITLTNYQAVPLVISNVAVTGDYQQSNNCGTSLAANANCTFNVTFHPTGSRHQDRDVDSDGQWSGWWSAHGQLDWLGYNSGDLRRQYAFRRCVRKRNPGLLVFRRSTCAGCFGTGSARRQLQRAAGSHGSSSAERRFLDLSDGDRARDLQVPTLTFWFWPSSQDSIGYDWQEAQIRDTGGHMLAQVMKVASNSQSWTYSSFDLTPYKGQTIQLYFNVHEDGDIYGYLSYMYLDDVAIVEGTPALRFTPVTPCRVVDTRGAQGAFGGPLFLEGRRAPSRFRRAVAAFHPRLALTRSTSRWYRAAPCPT